MVRIKRYKHKYGQWSYLYFYAFIAESFFDLPVKILLADVVLGAGFEQDIHLAPLQKADVI